LPKKRGEGARIFDADAWHLRPAFRVARCKSREVPPPPVTAAWDKDDDSHNAPASGRRRVGMVPVDVSDGMKGVSIRAFRQRT